jgi:hypothetical protein
MPCSYCRLKGHNISNCKNIKNAKDINYSKFWYSVCIKFIEQYKDNDDLNEISNNIIRCLEYKCKTSPYYDKLTSESVKNIVFQQLEHILYQYYVNTPYIIRKGWENTKEKNKKCLIYNEQWYEHVIEDYDYLSLPIQPISKWGKRQ